MASLKSRPAFDMHVSLQLNFDELMALKALSAFGVDQFLKVYYSQLGRSPLEDHEDGLVSLLKEADRVGSIVETGMRTAVKAFHDTYKESQK